MSLPLCFKKMGILNAYQFDLIYAQYGYLYIVIPSIPHTRSIEKNALGASHVVNVVIGLVMKASNQIS